MVAASWFKGPAGRARLAFLGAVVASAIVLFAWFPAGSLISQRSNLHGTEAELNALHAQDSALAQEKKNLSEPGTAVLRGPAALGRHCRRDAVCRRPGVGRSGHPVGDGGASPGGRHHHDHHHHHADEARLVG
jgi:hypothetical protein